MGRMIFERRRARRCILLVAAVLLIVWAGTQKSAEAGPLCSVCDSTESLASRFPVPDGYERVTVVSGSFADWLRGLPLLPPGTDATNWRGRVALRAAEIGAVVDWRLLGQVEQCADVAIRVFAEYARDNGGGDRIAFRSLSGQTIAWRKWLSGHYAVNGAGTAIRYSADGKRPDTPEEFDRYLKYVMTYANTASLLRDLERIESSEIAIGDVLIQPSPIPDGLGHMSIVVDACELPNGARRYLFVDGFTPARLPVVRQRETSVPETAWMTPTQYLDYMSDFGPGSFCHPPEWVLSVVP
jgi:hypothetical protein